MSLKSSNIRLQRLKSTGKTNSNLSLTIKSHFDDTLSSSKDISSKSVRKSKIPVLHIKNLSTTNQGTTSSRRTLKGLIPSRITKKVNFSMYTPSNKVLKTSRPRVSDSFSIHMKRAIEFPISSSEAIDYFKESLTEIEIAEIQDYKEIYFIGINLKKNDIDPNLRNFGFDNDKGDYKINIGDNILYRYEILSVLGRGSFGQVCKCLDHKNKEMVAVKIIRNKKRFHKQGLVEVKLLQQMKDEDPSDSYNIVRIKHSFLFRNHLCISFELLSMNLYEFVKFNGFQRMSISLVARFAVQILTGLQYAGSLNIIHCDLKPENILLKHPDKSGIKIIDFGSGCYESERIYTYIQSRFYRAPEIMLGIPYTCSIDMWSLACILVEIYTGYPLFPGENEQEQFLRIMEVLGLPSVSILAKSSRRKVFFDSQNKPRIVPNSRGKLRYPGTRLLQDIVGDEDVLFLNFLKDILTWDPQLRPSPNDALNHPWLIKIFKRQVSPTKKRRIIKSFLDAGEYRDM